MLSGTTLTFTHYVIHYRSLSKDELLTTGMYFLKHHANKTRSNYHRNSDKIQSISKLEIVAI